MKRRRQSTWIQRWARPLIAAIATVGALGTAYLTITKLIGGSTACPTEACDQVLYSPYAEVFGIPLSLFGCLAYASMGIFALAPLVVSEKRNPDLHRTLDNGITRAGGGSYVGTNAVGGLAGVVVLVGTLGLYANVDQTPAVASSSGNQAQQGPEITTTSGPAEIALARHLTAIGAKEYGAWWCPHCYEQKQLFGKEAFAAVNYIECASPDNPREQTAACREAGIASYPTWIINGQQYSGAIPLDQLADLSGYTGPRDFKNAALSRP